MNKLLFTGLLALSSVAIASANLGDNLQRSVGRYGPVSARWDTPDGEWVRFDTGQWSIREYFSAKTHRVEVITYAKHSLLISKDEAAVMLRTNVPASRNQNWKSGDVKWVNGEDGYSVWYNDFYKYTLNFYVHGLDANDSGYFSTVCIVTRVGLGEDRTNNPPRQQPDDNNANATSVPL